VAHVLIEGIRAIREVRDEQALTTSVIIVRDADPHAGQRRAGLGERAPGLNRGVAKPPMAQIVPEGSGTQVVGDINVLTPVAIIIQPGDGQTAASLALAADPACLRHILETAAPDIVVQAVRLGIIHFGRTVIPLPARVMADLVDPRPPQAVVTDIQIQPAIIIIVAKRGAGGVAQAMVRVAHARGAGHILEPPGPAQVAEQVAAAIARDIEVREAVVIVVSDRDALAVAGVFQPGPGSDVGKPRDALAVLVMIEGAAARPRAARKRSRLDEQRVEPAVIVIVEQRAAAAGRLDDGKLARRAI